MNPINIIRNSLHLHHPPTFPPKITITPSSSPPTSMNHSPSNMTCANSLKSMSTTTIVDLMIHQEPGSKHNNELLCGPKKYFKLDCDAFPSDFELERKGTENAALSTHQYNRVPNFDDNTTNTTKDLDNKVSVKHLQDGDPSQTKDTNQATHQQTQGSSEELAVPRPKTAPPTPIDRYIKLKAHNGTEILWRPRPGIFGQPPQSEYPPTIPSKAEATLSTSPITAVSSLFKASNQSSETTNTSNTTTNPIKSIRHKAKIKMLSTPKKHTATKVLETGVDTFPSPKSKTFFGRVKGFWKSTTDLRCSSTPSPKPCRQPNPRSKPYSQTPSPSSPPIPKIGTCKNCSSLHPLAGPTAVLGQGIEDASKWLISAASGSSNLILGSGIGSGIGSLGKKAAGSLKWGKPSDCKFTGLRESDVRGLGIIRTNSEESFVNVSLEGEISPTSSMWASGLGFAEGGEGRCRAIDIPRGDSSLPPMECVRPEQPELEPIDEDLLASGSWQQGLASWTSTNFNEVEREFPVGELVNSTLANSTASWEYLEKCRCRCRCQGPCRCTKKCKRKELVEETHRLECPGQCCAKAEDAARQKYNQWRQEDQRNRSIGNLTLAAAIKEAMESSLPRDPQVGAPQDDSQPNVRRSLSAPNSSTQSRPSSSGSSSVSQRGLTTARRTKTPDIKDTTILENYIDSLPVLSRTKTHPTVLDYLNGLPTPSLTYQEAEDTDLSSSVASPIAPINYPKISSSAIDSDSGFKSTLPPFLRSRPETPSDTSEHSRSLAFEQQIRNTRPDNTESQTGDSEFPSAASSLERKTYPDLSSSATDSEFASRPTIKQMYLPRTWHEPPSPASPAFSEDIADVSRAARGLTASTILPLTDSPPTGSNIGFGRGWMIPNTSEKETLPFPEPTDSTIRERRMPGSQPLSFSRCGDSQELDMFHSFSSHSSSPPVHLRGGGKPERPNFYLFRMSTSSDNHEVFDERVSSMDPCFSGYGSEYTTWGHLRAKLRSKVDHSKELVDEGSRGLDPKVLQELMRRMKLKFRRRKHFNDEANNREDMEDWEIGYEVTKRVNSEDSARTTDLEWVQTGNTTIARRRFSFETIEKAGGDVFDDVPANVKGQPLELDGSELCEADSHEILIGRVESSGGGEIFELDGKTFEAIQLAELAGTETRRAERAA